MENSTVRSIEEVDHSDWYQNMISDSAFYLANFRKLKCDVTKPLNLSNYGI